MSTAHERHVGGEVLLWKLLARLVVDVGVRHVGWRHACVPMQWDSNRRWLEGNLTGDDTRMRLPAMFVLRSLSRAFPLTLISVFVLRATGWISISVIVPVPIIFFTSPCPPRLRSSMPIVSPMKVTILIITIILVIAAIMRAPTTIAMPSSIGAIPIIVRILFSQRSAGGVISLPATLLLRLLGITRRIFLRDDLAVFCSVVAAGHSIEPLVGDLVDAVEDAFQDQLFYCHVCVLLLDGLGWVFEWVRWMGRNRY